MIIWEKHILVNKTLKFLLFGILMVLLGIYAVIFMIYAESYFLGALAVVCPFTGFVVGIMGVLDKKRIPDSLKLQDIPQYSDIKGEEVVRIAVIWKEEGAAPKEFSTEDKEAISRTMDMFSETGAFIAQNQTDSENGLAVFYDEKGRKTALPLSGLKYGTRYYRCSDAAKEFLLGLGGENVG